MQIANPIYDVVFKYLMEDNKVAKMFLSAIIDEKIITLDFRPQEFVLEIIKDGIKESVPQWTVYRMDFNAKVQLTDGNEKKIIIELQKARLTTDIMRFRRYLGSQYTNKENYYIQNGKKISLPILSIYFLGEGLERIKGYPIIHVKRDYIDKVNNSSINQQDEFIESLSHDSYIISIPDLTKKRKTELEAILSIFDQSERDGTHHILNVKEEDFPAKYRSIIRRLQKAKEIKKIRDIMDVEDDYIQELYDKEKAIENLKTQNEENKQRIIENVKTINHKNRVIEEKDRTIEEQKRLIAELMKKLKNQ